MDALKDLASWYKSLPTWQKIAVVAGGVGLVIVIWKPWKGKSEDGGGYYGGENSGGYIPITPPVSPGYPDMGGGNTGGGMDYMDMAEFFAGMNQSNAENLQALMDAQGQIVAGMNTSNAEMIRSMEQSMTVMNQGQTEIFRNMQESNQAIFNQMKDWIAKENTATPPQTTPTTPAGKFTNFTASNLKVGSKGGDVTNLQKNLAELGLYKGKIDGIFGTQTKTAVLQFQKSAGLKQDAVVGKNTYSALKTRLGG